jgi:hypothetical protein
MKDDGFSKVDFSHPEVRQCLARAYAVVLRITIPENEAPGAEESEVSKEHAPQQSHDEVTTEQTTQYVQQRLL